MADESEKAGEGAVAKVREALQSVLKALEKLSSEEQRRVLDAATTFFGAAPAAQVGGGADQGGALQKRSGKALSLREFMEQARPSTTPQKIATFAAYREQVDGGGNFSRADIQKYFSVAKEGEPANYARDFALAVKEGWIHESGSDSYLTATGEAAVKAGFGGKAKPRGRASAKRKKV